MSVLAIGTFRGDFSNADSIKYQESLEYALKNGITRIDTAVNYRGMRSERDIGIVLEKLYNDNSIIREDIIISSKCGFIPGDGEIMLRPVDYLREKFINTKILTMDDIFLNEDLRMTMHTGFFDYCINLSLEHMRTSYIDIHYIHEPELAYEKMGNTLFYKKLKNLFQFYEEQVCKGKIRSYGMATWEAFQVPESHPRHLSIEKVMNVAKEVSINHHFEHIMLPYSIDMPEANLACVQKIDGKYMTIFEAANKYGIHISTSGSIGIAKKLDEHSVLEYLSYSKNNPYIETTIVGMRSIEHTKENIELFNKA